VYHPQDGSFNFQRGPWVHNLILADEINRAPAKVQSALLEAMAERQISVGSETYPLPDLFLVMATQNPIEQEGTYALPEAQLDRFLMHVQITYPDAEDERRILRLSRDEAELGYVSQSEQPLVSQAVLFSARQEVLAVYMAENVEQYVLQFILATRDASAYGEDLARWIEYGVSPRASIALDRCARAHAWLVGRDFVAPEDVQAVVKDILRHRIIVNYEAEAEGISADFVVEQLMQRIAVP
jgi:MoxR-like ATPase